MFDEFTDRALKVIGLARQYAQRHDHHFLGTQHVLVGLIEEKDGIAASVLRKQGVTLEHVEAEMVRLVETKENFVPGKLPYTPRTKRVFAFAREAANHQGVAYVGTEHLLAGLLQEGEGVAVQILMNLGAVPKKEDPSESLKTDRDFMVEMLELLKDVLYEPEFVAKSPTLAAQINSMVDKVQKRLEGNG